MVILRYSQPKLYAAMACSGAACLFFLALWMGATRHLVTTPILFFVCLVGTVNLAFIASGDLAAIRATPEGLRIRAFWRMRSIPWSQLLRIRIERRVYRRHVAHFLMFDLSDGGLGDSVSLNIQHTEAQLETLPGFIDTIEGQWHRAKSGVGSIAARSTERAAGIPAVAAAPAVAARPGFGRKGL